ncbi:MAG: oxygenase MpaB family protein [Pseudomonadota bacterium]|nr:oxygenase MpaB family protein [Pseudomonadota bacterium]
MDEVLALRYGGDIRNLLLGNRTFILQLAHPAVGAGVVQHSNFRQDPWHRLREIAHSGDRMMFHGHDAAVAEGRRLRELHRHIHGHDAHGRRYHALNPEVYGWVHFVFYETTLACHQLFGDGVPEAHQELLFQNWRASGAYFGLRDKDLPASRQAYWSKWWQVLSAGLETNAAIEYILNLSQHCPPPPPALQRLPETLWRTLWRALGTRSDLATRGMLPPALRQRLGLEWNATQAREFERNRRRIQRLFRALPADWRLLPAARQRLHALP